MSFSFFLSLNKFTLVTALNLLEDLAYEVTDHMVAGNPVETIRKYFPETWIWDIVTVK